VLARAPGAATGKAKAKVKAARERMSVGSELIILDSLAVGSTRLLW
jgi:hypothetical protein